MRTRVLAFAALLTLAPSTARADDDPWFGTDKALHFDLSVALASGAYAISSLQVKPMWERAVIGGSVSLALGAGKELADMVDHGDPSWRDFTWDAIGTAVGLGLAMALDAITRSAQHESTGATANGLVVRF